MAAKQGVCSYISGVTAYTIIQRVADSFVLDDVSGEFASNPADKYLSLTEDTHVPGLYAVSESRAIWDDGEYLWVFYHQAGASPSSTDPAIASGVMHVQNDAEVTDGSAAAASMAHTEALFEIRGLGRNAAGSLNNVMDYQRRIFSAAKDHDLKLRRGFGLKRQ